jgi:hypothetical protein
MGTERMGVSAAQLAEPVTNNNRVSVSLLGSLNFSVLVLPFLFGEGCLKYVTYTIIYYNRFETKIPLFCIHEQKFYCTNLQV